MKKIGPACYVEWNKERDGRKETGVIEYPLFSDAYSFVDDIVINQCPYQILAPDNTPKNNLVLMRLILRVKLYETESSTTESPINEAPFDFYLQTNPHEQIASLLSLCLGVRIKVGAISRIFNNTDPLGIPCTANTHENPPPVSLIGDHVVLPSALRNIYENDSIFSLSTIEQHLSSFIRLTPEQAELLVCAAKLYRDALWLIETEPQLAWIMLVSALEVIAAKHITLNATPKEVFEDLHPDLTSEILSRQDGTTLLSKIADIFIDKKLVGKKYLNFLLDFLPEPPPIRGLLNMQIDWSELKRNNNKNPLMTIYDYRSKALHAGKPFPLEMCYGPRGTGIPYELTEKPQSAHVIHEGKHLKNKPGPMLINTFEYIVRNALLNWWNKCGNS